MVKYWNKGFIEMKFDQFMMNLFDLFVKYFRSKETLSWYIEFSLGIDDKIDSMQDKIWELEDKIHDQDIEIDHLDYHLIDSEEKLKEAYKKISFYEYKEDEEA